MNLVLGLRQKDIYWQKPVIRSDLSVPPISPIKGDRYIVGHSAIGAWIGKDRNIAEWKGSSWTFLEPISRVCYDYNLKQFLFFDADVSEWEIMGTKLEILDTITMQDGIATYTLSAPPNLTYPIKAFVNGVLAEHTISGDQLTITEYQAGEIESDDELKVFYFI